jgi:hypothetical protein
MVAVALVSTVAAMCLGGCGAASGPGDPSPAATPTTPTTSVSAEPSPSGASPGSPSADGSSQSATPAGLTLRQLGFDNGPLDAFSLPRDSVISTAVDQPNVVTIVLAGPSPQTVEGYLRDTLPRQGFTIDARADAGQAMTFDGNGWSGAFTGTGATSAIVLRPA